VPSEGASAVGKQRLFLSYGHDEFEGLAIRLVEDLLATQRYEVWFDKHDILPGSQWEHEIQKGVVWVAEGPSKGWVSNLEPMLKEYYRVRGWDENGVPKPSRLKELSLDSLMVG